jgi:TctA family transporter
VYTLQSSMFDPFLPLFSGMFAIGAILNYQHGSLPEQKEEPIPPGILKFSLLGVLGGFFADLLPGISSASQMAVLMGIFLPMRSLGYLASIASVSISSAILSFSTAASIDKARAGATVWLSKTLPVEENLIFILVIFLLAITLAATLIYLGRKILANLAHLNFNILNKLLILYLIGIVFLLNGAEGLVILVLGSVLGYLTIKLNIERRNLMGAVIFPTLLLLFRIFI